MNSGASLPKNKEKIKKKRSKRKDQKEKIKKKKSKRKNQKEKIKLNHVNFKFHVNKPIDSFFSKCI